MKILLLSLLIFSSLFAQKVALEVLGSGGPEIDGRASSSYILWIDDEAKLLIDMGSGSMLNFEKSGARLESLDAVVLTHLHIDHSVDLPSYVKAGFFSSRTRSLEIIAPHGNQFFPSISEYLQRLFGKNGAYSYMQDVLLSSSDSFEIIPFEVDSNSIINKKYKDFSLKIINVHHGIVPALALQIQVGKKSIVISGDTNNKDGHLSLLLENANLFIAHHAITKHAGHFAKDLHITPSQIASISQKTHVKKIVLSHRMKRTLNHEQDTLRIIKKEFDGEVIFAQDRMRFEL